MIFALGACGQQAEKGSPSEGSKGTAAAMPAVKACDVLTQADAEAVLGHKVEKLNATGGAAGYDICQFGYQGEKLMDTGQATVTLHAVDLGSMKKGVEDQGYSVEAVPGLGDQAFWSKDIGLYVGKGNRTAIYLAGTGGASDDENKAKEIALAKATVSRL
jgi:hypothetical protein